jgi:hypothetical protein
MMHKISATFFGSLLLRCKCKLFLFLNFDADNKVILAGISVMGISSFGFANQPPGLSRPGVGECKSN